jgi:hypothetical protein
MEGIGHGLFKYYYPCNCLDGMRKTTMNLCQDCWSLDQDLNPGPPKYKAGVLTVWPRCLVIYGYYIIEILISIYIKAGSEKYKRLGRRRRGWHIILELRQLNMCELEYIATPFCIN